jgi:sulfofructose kinase
MAQTARSNLLKTKPLIVGVGLCAIDYLSLVNKYPGPDEKHDALKCVVAGGGPVPTALCAIGKLGGRVAFIGKCGVDHEGAFVKAELERFGVDTQAMIFDSKCQTPRAFIWVDNGNGSRSVVLDRTKMTDLKLSELDTTLLHSCRYLLIDGRESKAAVAAATIAKKAGAEIILDAGSPRKNIETVLPLIDHLVVSKSFADTYTGKLNPLKAVAKLFRPTMKSAVITLGEKGAVFTEGAKAYHQPAFNVDVVDTTGAGDVFHGAFVYGLSQSWSMPEIVRFACAAAALKCQKIGGRAGIVGEKEVRKFAMIANH